MFPVRRVHPLRDLHAVQVGHRQLEHDPVDSQVLPRASFLVSGVRAADTSACALVEVLIGIRP